MLKKMHCRICGGDIVVMYKTYPTTFEIKNGKLVVEDSLRPNNELEFYCDRNPDHDIFPPIDSKQHKLFMKWCDTVEEYFYNNSLWGET